MRFYFHLFNGIETLDEEGRELPDLDAAVGLARHEARTMAAESVKRGHLNLGHHVQIGDADGETLRTVAFGDVVEVTPR